MIIRLRLLIVIALILVIAGLAVLYLPKILGDIAYPLPVDDQLTAIRQAALEFDNVPLTLIVAVAKHESGFRSDALSSANARGIMQIVPGTGAGLAKELNIANYSLDALFNASINIRLGSYYLSKLLKKYNGDVRSTLAHYNAGPRGPDLLTDPARETKTLRGVEGYARRVIATQSIYEQLYGKNLDHGPGPLVKPEKSFLEQVKEVKNLLPLLFK